MKPKLRFKEFSGDWEEKKFKQVINSFDYGMNSSAVEFDGENKYIRITDIDENTHKYLNNNIVSPSGKLEDKYIVQKNDILFARTGASTGKTYLYDEKDGKLYFAGFLIRGNVKEEYNSYFVFSQTLTENYNKWVYLISMRSGQPGINSNEYSNYKCKFPSLAEQTKIADFLSTVDEKIQNQQDKITHLENIKKGFMQRIFSRKIRFKDDYGNEFPEWEEKKLGEITCLKKGVQLDKDEIVEGGKYYHLNGGINPSNYTNKYNVQENTISISEGGNSCGYINWNKEKFFSGGHNYTLQNVSSFIDKYYLYQYLKYNEDKIMRLRVGSGLPNIQQKDLNKFIIKVPLLIEQEKIADFLSSFDKKIDVEKDTLNHLKELKKGLLQQVLV